MVLIGRIVLLGALLAAPWPFGSVTPDPQWLLCATVAALLLWRLADVLRGEPEGAFHVPTAAVAAVGLLLVAAVQLLPREESPVPQMKHAVFAEMADAFAGDGPTAGSVAPASTGARASLLFFALGAFFLGAQWFSTVGAQVWLWRVLAVNGAVLGFFGIVQKVTWDGQLFWSVPLRLGGTPFASFVNRNNAAGYLNLCLAAGIGWLMLRLGPRMAFLPRGDRPELPGLPGKARLLRAIAAVDGSELGLVGVLIVMAAAVLYSLSRGGILAMIVGFGLMVWWQRGMSRVAGALLLATLGAAAVGTLAWVGGWDAVQQRLSSLSDPAAAAEGRLFHWWDTSGAVMDFPILGAGLGTYRYANLPYQVHQGSAWYVNADNHFFEMLVETGFAGLLLYASGFVLTGLAAGFLIRQDQADLRAVGMLGMFAVAAQAVQATTDFGLLIPANALTFAVLCGSVCGTACAAADFQQLHAPFWLGLARLEGRWSNAGLWGVLTLASVAFGLELFVSTQATAANSAIIAIDPSYPLETRPELFDGLIEQGEDALRWRPDDPELHRAIGLWWISRYRLEAARELDRAADPANRLRGRRLWQATSLTVLGARALSMRQQGDRGQLERLRRLPLVRDHLIPAREHLVQASRNGPLTRDVSRFLADLWFVSEAGDERDWPGDLADSLSRAMFIAPSSPDQLFSTGLIAERAGLMSLADQAFFRCLTVSDKHLMPVWSIVSGKRPVAELVGSVIPDRPGLLISLAEQTPDEVVKRTLVTQASLLLNKEEWANVGESAYLLQARLAELQGQNEQAIQQYKLALGAHSWEIETRLRLARLLLQEGRLREAEGEFSLLRALAPQRADIKRQLEELKRGLLNPPPDDAE